MDGSRPPAHPAPHRGAPGRRAAVARWLEATHADLAPDVRWSAPRRGLALAGRHAVLAQLLGELEAMHAPEVSVLRPCGEACAGRRFHEYTIRFRLLEPGIAGLFLPAGTEVELERLRVLECDGGGWVVSETCIETWTRLRGGRAGEARSPDRT